MKLRTLFRSQSQINTNGASSLRYDISTFSRQKYTATSESFVGSPDKKDRDDIMKQSPISWQLKRTKRDICTPKKISPRVESIVYPHRSSNLEISRRDRHKHQKLAGGKYYVDKTYMSIIGSFKWRTTITPIIRCTRISGVG